MVLYALAKIGALNNKNDPDEFKIVEEITGDPLRLSLNALILKSQNE
jgi:hypothetical protein